MDHNSLLTEKNVLLYAAKYYDSAHCLDIEDFQEDLNRIKYIKKLFTTYEQTKQLKVRLILNHFIVLNNVFDNKALVRILFLKMPNYSQYFLPFLMLLNILPDQVLNVHKNPEVINTDEIEIDQNIVNQLRVICGK